jgi:hypothetical protein
VAKAPKKNPGINRDIFLVSDALETHITCLHNAERFGIAEQEFNRFFFG